jgi:GT2 family glycosyltransferase
MRTVESSIIIPAYNQWKLTRACLEALAGTLVGKAVEVIVVDNASSDETPAGCPVLGETCFGTAFKHHQRQD